MAVQKTRSFFILFFIILPLLIVGTEAKSPVPSYQTSGITPPLVKKDTLLNELQLMTIEQPGTRDVSIRVRINSGALFDLLGKGGMADLTAGMLLRGGGGLTAENIKDIVEQVGIRISAEVAWDCTDLHLSGPPDALDDMFDLLGRLLIFPAFDQKELDSLKAQRLSQLRSEEGNIALEVKRKAMEAVFGNHPLGKPERGTAESLQKISRDDLLYFHKKYYLANNATLIAVGGVTAEQVTKLARTRLGAWMKGDKIAPMFRAPDAQAARRVLIIDRPEARTTYCTVAQVGFSRRAEDYFAAFVMAEVLKARMEKAEGIQFESRALLIDGPIAWTITSSPSDTGSRVEKSLTNLIALQTTAPSKEEVDLAKTHVVSAFEAQVQNKPAELLLDVELYKLGKDYLLTYMHRVNAVSPTEVQKAAQKYLKPQAVSVVILGEAKSLEGEVRKLGAVTVTP